MNYLNGKTEKQVIVIASIFEIGTSFQYCGKVIYGLT
jgi:hypothetical protein